jgi:hypothetical protein
VDPTDGAERTWTVLVLEKCENRTNEGRTPLLKNARSAAEDAPRVKNGVRVESGSRYVAAPRRVTTELYDKHVSEA